MHFSLRLSVELPYPRTARKTLRNEKKIFRNKLITTRLRKLIFFQSVDMLNPALCLLLWDQVGLENQRFLMF